MHIFGFYLPWIYIFGFILAVVLVGAALRAAVPDAVRAQRRATMQDETAARLVGIDVNRVAALTFGIGVAVTAAGGMVYGATNAFNPNSGYDLISRLLAIIILGGWAASAARSPRPSFMLTLESVVTIWQPTWAVAVFYAALVLVLLDPPERPLRPQGGASPVNEWHRAWTRASRAAACCALIVLAIAFPQVFTNPAITTTACFALIYVAVASAWNIFSGNTGYISLGQAVFFGSGAYAMGIAARDWHIDRDHGLRAAATLRRGRRGSSRSRSGWSRCGCGGTRSS